MSACVECLMFTILPDSPGICWLFFFFNTLGKSLSSCHQSVLCPDADVWNFKWKTQCVKYSKLNCLLYVYIHPSIHAYIHTYIHTHIYSHIHPIHTCTYIHTYVRTYIHTYICTHTYIKNEATDQVSHVQKSTEELQRLDFSVLITMQWVKGDHTSV